MNEFVGFRLHYELFALPTYTLLKYAELELMKALAAEFAEKCVNVNAASPGKVKTRSLSWIVIATVNNRMALTRSLRKLSAINLVLSPAADYIAEVNVPI